MNPDPQNSSSTNLLGSFTGLIGILGIFLYFLGWIYRWAYFGFFELEITALNLPLESFLIVPIQVILGNFWIFFRTISVLIITILLIKSNIWLISPPKASTPSSTSQSAIRRFTQRLHNFWLFKPLRSFAQLLPLPLRHEIVIVIWILTALFWLGHWQGNADAYRDAVNETSTRPIITLATPVDKRSLGIKPDDLTNAIKKDSRIIGDLDQFKQIWGQEINDKTNPKQPIVWRLLTENNNWVYIFPAMRSGSKSDQRPLVLAVNTSDGQVQFLILSRPKMLP